MAEILILGSDKRLQYVAAALEKIYTIQICRSYYENFFSDKNKKYKAIVLGIPCSTDGENINMPLSDKKLPFNELCGFVEKNGIITGGMIPTQLYDICKDRGIACEDYYKNEAVILKNAVPSAEGALALGINMTAETIHNSKVLVMGYGRIATLLAKYLKMLGAEVTVAARKEEKRVSAQINGCKPVEFDELCNIIGNFSLIYNTVPAIVVDENTAAKIKKTAVYIELASKPGIDTALCDRLGINFVNAQGLPAKTAPKTAGEIIADSIKQILDRHGMETLS